MLRKILNSKIVERTRRSFAKSTGIYLKLKRLTASSHSDLRTALILNSHKIDLVIDVGANTGQFAESLLDFGYKGEIISFEPIKECHDVLMRRSAKYQQWTIANRCAIGAENEDLEMNITGETVFSSLLDTKEWHAALKVGSEPARREVVPVRKLDTELHKYIDDPQGRRILLKIDTQGYEKQVLDGAAELLQLVEGVKIEIPLVPLYENVDLTFYSSITFMQEMGLEPYSFNIEGVNLKTGRVNTIDGLFLR